MSFATVVFITFVIIVGIQIAYYLTFLFTFSAKTAEIQTSKDLPLSLIICAKNEAKNLKTNLPFILNQTHSNFEVVLVNDSSSDKTLKVMKEFASQYDNIKIVDVKSVEAFWGNKKYALTLGIKASKNHLLVFTDADCKPSSTKWLSHINSNFSKEKAVVLGYGAYAKKKYSVLNALIRFETIMTAIQYLSYTKLGIPYMGVGRNMAYKKELFFGNNGFNSHMHIKSGDDDLFINEVANKTNTSICIDKESFTISEPKTTFMAWFTQKRRHISTSRLYKLKHKYLLGLFFLSNLLFWFVGVLLIFLGIKLHWVMALVAIRFIIQWITLGVATKKLDDINLIYVTPFLELFLITTQLSIFIANLISTPKHWK